MKRPLSELSRGDIFRTADGLLWVRHRGDGVLTLDGGHAYCLPLGGGQAAAHGLDTLVEPLNLPALLSRLAGLEKENAELRAVLHDLWQDRTAAAVGAEAERGAVRALIDDTLRGVTGVHDAVAGRLLAALEARGPTRPPVPPCALEGSVREAVGMLGGARVDLRGVGLAGYDTERVDAVLARLRAALGED